MKYWLVKSNPDSSYHVDKALLDLKIGRLERWIVIRKARIGGLVFAGRSRRRVAVLAELSVISDPVFEPFIAPCEALTLDTASTSSRWVAPTRVVKGLMWGGVSEVASREAGLARVRQFLHRPGHPIQLPKEDARLLESLFPECPVTDATGVTAPLF